ncbi:hypothetical protein CYQ27_15130 [Enterococcus faecalis]|uniref:hypothetical protein n=1 Tax=Enterococcus faecalis TaxID=1351 RepID=UPI00100E4F87|nr:hypothetical protein [Enterococcus faecalis]RXV42048.1 hypothetical protein CYQ27_15130 [Enterococcus faecalis]
MKKEELLERREKHFASKGRELSEFKKGDKVLNNLTNRIGIVQLVDDDGDVVVNYNNVGLLLTDDYKCEGALYLELIQTIEKMEEAE